MKNHGHIFGTAALVAIVTGQIAFQPLAFAQPTVSVVVTDGAAAETLPGQTANPGMIRVSRTGSTAAPLRVSVRVRGLAEQGVDYTFGIAIGSALTIPAGQSFLDIPVTPIDDVLTEGEEDVRLELLDSPTGAYLVGDDDRGDVDIADNEDPTLPPRALVTITATDPDAAEALSGADANTAIFRVARVGNLAVELNINYTLGGSATPGTDYLALPGVITLPAGVASTDVIIAPLDDADIEGTETVTVTLTPSGITGTPPPATAYVIGTPSNAVVTLRDNDFHPPPAVTITTPLPNAVAIVGEPVSVAFTASDVDGYIASYSVTGSGMIGTNGVTGNPTNTAAGTPFNGSAVVTFQSTFTHIFTVRVVDNLGNVGSATGSIYVINAPEPPRVPPVLPIINIYALDTEGAEVTGDPPNVASFRVTHNFPPTNAVSFLFALSGTAKQGIDYTVSPASNITSSFLGNWFTIPAGQTEAEFVVTPVDDFFIESTETVTLSLYTPPFIGFTEGTTGGGPPPDWYYSFGFYYGSNSTATVSIRDNDTAPPPFNVVTLAATDPVASEIHPALGTNDPGVFTLTRIGSNTAPIVVRYAFTPPPRSFPFTAPMPAIAINGVDYETLSGTVTFAEGATTAQIVVNPIFDADAEPLEAVYLTLLPSLLPLSDPGSYAIDEDIRARVEIQSFSLPGVPVITIRANDPHAIEDNVIRRNGSIIVSRQGFSASDLTVRYRIGGSASNGVDYQFLPGFVTIPAGTNGGAMITIVPINDPLPERMEAVGLTILPPPADIFPPPYLVGNPRSAGVGIRDKLRFGQMDWLPGGIAVVPVPPTQLIADPATGGMITNYAPCWSIEASTDLATWELIGTSDAAAAAGEVNHFMDVEAVSYPQRFYRMKPCE